MASIMLTLWNTSIFLPSAGARLAETPLALSLQGMTCQDVKKLISRPETAQAIHRVAHLFAAAVPSFKKLRLADLRQLLQDVSSKLVLLEACSTRIKLMPSGADVTAASSGFKVWKFFHDRLYLWALLIGKSILHRFCSSNTSGQKRKGRRLPCKESLRNQYCKCTLVLVLSMPGIADYKTTMTYAKIIPN